MSNTVPQIHLTKDQENLLDIINGICTFLSFTGSLFVIVFYYTYKQLQSFSMKLLVFLCLSNIIYAIANFISVFIPMSQYSSLCYVEGLFREFGSVSAVTWVATMCYVCYQQVVMFDRNIQKRFCRYLTFNIAISTLLTVIPAFGKFSTRYGTDGLWCTVVDGSSIHWYFYGPIWIIIVFTAVISVRIAKKMTMTNPNYKKRKIMIYPILLSLSWIPALIDRVTMGITGERFYGCVVIHMVCTHSQGFVYAIYCGGNKIFPKLKSKGSCDIESPKKRAMLQRQFMEKDDLSNIRYQKLDDSGLSMQKQSSLL